MRLAVPCLPKNFRAAENTLLLSARFYPYFSAVCVRLQSTDMAAYTIHVAGFCHRVVMKIVVQAWAFQTRPLMRA